MQLQEAEFSELIQEALQNVYKHAHANKVEINVISKNKIIIYIKDNGHGFNPDNLQRR